MASADQLVLPPAPIDSLFLATVATANIHPARGTGFAIGGLQRVVGQPHGAALAVQGIHIAEGADGAELRHDTLGLGGLADQGGAQPSDGEESGGTHQMGNQETHGWQACEQHSLDVTQAFVAHNPVPRASRPQLRTGGLSVLLWLDAALYGLRKQH